jgi:predicted dehydrogenase
LGSSGSARMVPSEGKLCVAMVGVGRWGRNLLRNFSQADRCAVTWVCDVNRSALEAAGRQVPAARSTERYGDLLTDGSLDAVVIASSAVSHYELCRQALDAGKHVYVEKPLALRATHAEELAGLAEQRGRKLMVGHLLEYHPSVLAMREMIQAGRLGRVYYMYCQRVNLGVVRQDENAWWSLAPHDVSVICFLFEAEPVSVSACGQCYLQAGVEDVVFANLRFGDGRLANVHVSWLDPHKIRRMTVVGTERMVSFDDMEASEKLRVYDKGAEVRETFESFAQTISLRIGDILIPKVDTSEPLRQEVGHFIGAVLEDQQIRSDGADGARVVRILEAGSESLRRGGQPVEISSVGTA